MVRKVTLYSDPKDPYCVEIEKFLKGFEIILTVHDIRTDPLNAKQLSNLLGHFELEHFVNSNGKSSKKLDLSSANREKILDLIADDNSLLKKPLIVSGRLMTIGYDRRKILDMLQIKADQSQPELRADSAA